MHIAHFFLFTYTDKMTFETEHHKTQVGLSIGQDPNPTRPATYRYRHKAENNTEYRPETIDWKLISLPHTSKYNRIYQYKDNSRIWAKPGNRQMGLEQTNNTRYTYTSTNNVNNMLLKTQLFYYKRECL